VSAGLRSRRIHGELRKLGIDIAQSNVAKYMSRRRGPRFPGWQAFLRNHTAHIAGVDPFVVPTIEFKLLYGLVILRLERRRLVWTDVTQIQPPSGSPGRHRLAYPATVADHNNRVANPHPSRCTGAALATRIEHGPEKFDQTVYIIRDHSRRHRAPAVWLKLGQFRASLICLTCRHSPCVGRGLLAGGD
jgi:hypothetical protein